MTPASKSALPEALLIAGSAMETFFSFLGLDDLFEDASPFFDDFLSSPSADFFFFAVTSDIAAINVRSFRWHLMYVHVMLERELLEDRWKTCSDAYI